MTIYAALNAFPDVIKKRFNFYSDAKGDDKSMDSSQIATNDPILVNEDNFKESDRLKWDEYGNPYVI